jgi:hypothetical protein
LDAQKISNLFCIISEIIATSPRNDFRKKIENLSSPPLRLSHKLSSTTSYNTTIMTSFFLSDFMLSLPANLVLVSDNAKSASQPAAPPAGKLVKACRWSETKASVSLPKAPKAPSRPQACNFVWDEPSSCSTPSKVSVSSPKAPSLVSRAAFAA